MCRRNPIYTGVTRSKKLDVIVGQAKAIAMDNVSRRQRSMKLKGWLTHNPGAVVTHTA
jgi:ATP-dependent exoDNAse (exonuclease V) alpha subunit